jgi:hypothetical protein
MGAVRDKGSDKLQKKHKGERISNTNFQLKKPSKL